MIGGKLIYILYGIKNQSLKKKRSILEKKKRVYTLQSQSALPFNS